MGSRPNSSGETSPVEEEDETVVGTGTGTGHEIGNPVLPLPSLVSVIESASTTEHELGDTKSSISSCPPSPQSSPSSSSVHPSSSSTPSSYTGVDMPPPSVLLAPTSLGLDAEVGAGYCDRSGKLISLPRSPAMSAAPQVSPPSVPPPPKLALRSSILPGDQMPPVVDIDSTPASSVELRFVDDDDADQFMDQFMEHYEDQRDDASRQDQEGPSQEEDNDVMVSLGKVDKRVVVDEDGDQMQMQLTPQPWSSTSLLAAATVPAIPLVDAASVSSSETLSTSATLTAFPRTSSPVLASDDSSLYDSYLYTYPYPSSRQNGEMDLELKGSSVSIPSATDSTPPASATWSTSESASVSRSRSFSSTYTSLSFGSESETSSCPQSSVEGDDINCRYSSGIQHPLLPPQPQPPMLVKSPTDSVLHAAEVSVLGSPPALTLPFSGNEDIGYFVSVPGPGLISKSPVHRGGALSSTMELSTRDDDTNSTTTTTYLAYHDDEIDSDVHVEKRAGSVQSERKDVEGEILSQKCEEGIMRKKYDLATEVKAAVKATEFIEAEVERDYIIGNKPFAASNGRLNTAFNGHGQERKRHAIATVTPDAVSSDEPVNDDTKLVTTKSRYSPPLLSATNLATPAMTLSTSHTLLKDDLACGSSTAVAEALPMSSWKRDTSEMAEGSSYSSTHKSDRSVSHVIHAVLVDNDHDEKRRRRTAGLERGGRRDLLSYSAISSRSSSSSSNDDDDDHYGPPNNSSPSQSHAVVNVNLRTRHSRTPSSISATSPGYMSPSPKSPVVSRNNGSKFSEDDDDDDDVEDEDDQEDDEDDDVPLAKRIPGALTAQKSIRRQVRQEREKKKQEKILRGHAETVRTRLMTLRPGAVPSSSHETATALVASQTAAHRNSRTLTRNSSRSLNPFPPEDLVRKRDINGSDGVAAATTPVDATSLYQQQALHSRLRSKSMTRPLRDVRPSSTTETLPPVPVPQSHPPSSRTQRTKSVKEPSSPYHYHTSPSPTPINSTYAPSSITPLRPMRSFHFHRPSTDRRPIGMDDPRSVPLPLDAEKRISRNSSSLVSRSGPSTREGSQQQTFTFPTTTSTHHHRSLSRSRSSIERTSPIPIPEPVPPIPTTARISHGEYHELFKFHHYDSSSSRAGSNRISADADKHLRAPSRQQRPPPVPVPSTSTPVDPLPVISSKPDLVVQQRVFIGNMQRFNMVEIGASTTAGDVVEMIEAEGSFKDFVGSGGWMVFEVAQDFGMGTFFFPFLHRYVSVCFNSHFFFSLF